MTIVASCFLALCSAAVASDPLPDAKNLAARGLSLVWRDSRPHLPAELLVRRAGHYGVFVLAAGKVHFEPVDGAQEGRPAAVDLPPATQIVVPGGHHFDRNAA
ncbi:MAG TPA: hypothetical protein PLQ12_11205, partial [Candidatus Defluviicoccus seviourii]|nr:hypothetical protein [Candidatus Defluviicoccus seviourii]